jgi:hypothetical protein
VSETERCECGHLLEHHWPDGFRGCFAKDVIGPWTEACPCGRYSARTQAPQPARRRAARAGRG